MGLGRPGRVRLVLLGQEHGGLGERGARPGDARPADWRGEKLLQAVQNGEVPESKLDESVRRLLLLLERAGKFEHPQEAPEQAIDRPEHRALIREAAGEGLVLLKNARGVLPLERETLKSIAIIGPNAKEARIMGGGSAQVNAHYRVTPFDGIRAKVGADATVGFAQGLHDPQIAAAAHRRAACSRAQDGTAPGLQVEYFNGDHPDRHAGSHDAGRLPPSSPGLGRCRRGWTGAVRGARHGALCARPEWRLHLRAWSARGRAACSLDGHEVIDNWTGWTGGGNYFGMGSDEQTYQAELSADREYPLVLEFRKDPTLMLSAVRLGVLAPLPADLLEQAVALAAQADVALVFAGLSSEWESEGFDRADLELPGTQNELITKVAAANPKTVVVLNAGSAVTMPWLDEVAAVLQVWYPGQEAGNAIADVLFGDVNPSGKLPQTFPRAPGGHSQLPQLPRRERQGALRRADLRRLPLLREEAHRAALPVRLWPVIYHL